MTREDIARIIKESRMAAGLTQSQVAEALGRPQNTISAWEMGRAQPDANTLFELFRVLGRSVDEAFGFPARSFAVTAREREHIEALRVLDTYGQDMVSAVLERERKRCMEQAREKAKEKARMEAAAEITGTFIDLEKIMPFRRSYQPASAGTGIFLGPEEFEMIYVQINDLTRRASFGIPVSGDSMEPDYHDGDVLLVERAEDIRMGETGIFTINGAGFVKERGDGELISLNPAYAPIPMDESIRCNGRVIGILEPEWIVEK